MYIPMGSSRTHSSDLKMREMREITEDGRVKLLIYLYYKVSYILTLGELQHKPPGRLSTNIHCTRSTERQWQ